MRGARARLGEGDRRRPEAARPPMAARRRGWARPCPGFDWAGPAGEEKVFFKNIFQATKNNRNKTNKNII